MKEYSRVFGFGSLSSSLPTFKDMSEVVLTLPRLDNATSNSRASIYLLAQAFIIPHVAGLKVVEGDEVRTAAQHGHRPVSHLN